MLNADCGICGLGCTELKVNEEGTTHLILFVTLVEVSVSLQLCSSRARA